jgi:hypothetical protein
LAALAGGSGDLNQYHLECRLVSSFLFSSTPNGSDVGTGYFEFKSCVFHVKRAMHAGFAVSRETCRFLEYVLDLSKKLPFPDFVVSG